MTKDYLPLLLLHYLKRSLRIVEKNSDKDSVELAEAIRNVCQLAENNMAPLIEALLTTEWRK